MNDRPPPGRLTRWAQAGGATAVLRVEDQARDRSPVACVKTGERTERAIRAAAPAVARAEVAQLLVGSGPTIGLAWLLRRPRTVVVLAVTERAWRVWRTRLAIAIIASTLGLGLIGAGLLGGHPERIAPGVILVIVGWVVRVVAARRHWVGLRFRPERAEVLVFRASEGFDAEARRLYTASIGWR